MFVAWPAQTWAAPGTKPGAGVVQQLAAFSLRIADTFGGAKLLSSAFGDPNGSSTNSLGAQFLGDYATAVASKVRLD